MKGRREREGDKGERKARVVGKRKREVGGNGEKRMGEGAEEKRSGRGRR